MKTITLESGFLAYQKLFKEVVSKSSPLVAWQVSPSGKRTVTDAVLNSFSIESRSLHFEFEKKDLLDSALTVYFYCEEGQFIFKSKFLEVRGALASIYLPFEIQFLEDPDVHVMQRSFGSDLSTKWKSKRIPIREVIKPDYLILTSMEHRTARDKDYLKKEFNFMSLDEEDKAFADKRESPRARPSSEKSVRVASEKDTAVKTQLLFDLSQGGISFITSDTDIYPVGGRVKIVGFEDFDLDDPLLAEVMSQRPVDELQLDFKIGCKFIEGQS